MQTSAIARRGNVETETTFLEMLANKIIYQPSQLSGRKQIRNEGAQLLAETGVREIGDLIKRGQHCHASLFRYLEETHRLARAVGEGISQTVMKDFCF